jgi:hypothetical protein
VTAHVRGSRLRAKGWWAPPYTILWVCNGCGRQARSPDLRLPAGWADLFGADGRVLDLCPSCAAKTTQLPLYSDTEEHDVYTA